MRTLTQNDVFNPNTITEETETNDDNEDVSRMTTDDFDVLVFTLFGKHDAEVDGYPILLDRQNELAENRDEAFAMLVKDDEYDKVEYYVKFGGVDGRLQNPVTIFGQNYARNRTRLPSFKFVKVKKKVFELYIDFLKTKNEAYLRNAEREGLK